MPTTSSSRGGQSVKPLAEISSFGAIDADFDELLDSCFQDHEAYVSAQSHGRFLVVGRKGSGKTAIFKKLIRTRAYDFFAFGHTFSDYPWQHHQLQESLGVPEELRYVHSWQYLILLTAAKVLLNQDQSQPWDEASMAELGKLESFVVDSYGSRDPDVTQLFMPAKRLRIQPHLKIPYIGEAGLDLERLPIEYLPKVFQDVTRTIGQAVATCLNPRHNYYVCFDELDRGFDPGDDRYKRMLVGLILAARAVNQLARDSGKRFSVVVFLRDDIYQMLRFEDKNKITENFLSRIEWDSARTRWTLQELMERRFGATVAERVTLEWGEVFDESQEMPGRQSKYRHILDRTFRRPRDMIKFCNEVLAAYKRRAGNGGGRFANEDIIAARHVYSDYLLRELQDEVHKHEPNYEDYLEIAKSLEALQFSREEFDEACRRRPDLLRDRVTPTEVLRRLFEFSVVGYQRTGGVGGGSEYLYRYMDPTVRFDEAAGSFRVHPGFMEAFGLKKFRRGE
jgi:hypothetical protein